MFGKSEWNAGPCTSCIIKQCYLMNKVATAYTCIYILYICMECTNFLGAC